MTRLLQSQATKWILHSVDRTLLKRSSLSYLRDCENSRHWKKLFVLKKHLSLPTTCKDFQQILFGKKWIAVLMSASSLYYAFDMRPIH